MLPTSTVGTPGTHGATVAGMQGAGVSTPSAAAVAAATAGLAMLMHVPKGMMLRKGTLSKMLATGVPATTRFFGSTASEDGAAPIEHLIIVPALTKTAMASLHQALSGLASSRYPSRANVTKISMRAFLASAPLRY